MIISVTPSERDWILAGLRLLEASIPKKDVQYELIKEIAEERKSPTMDAIDHLCTSINTGARDMLKRNKKNKKNKVPERFEAFETGTFYIAICGCEDFVFVSDRANICLEELNAHLECEHQGESSILEDCRIFKSTTQIQLGIEETRSLVFGRSK